MATIPKKIKVGDVGTVYRLLVKKEDGTVFDISTATTMKLKVKKVDGTEIERTCSHTTDGTDGLMQYKVLQADVDTGDFHDVAGETIIAGYVDIPAPVTWAGHTTEEVVRIYPVFGV